MKLDVVNTKPISLPVMPTPAPAAPEGELPIGVTRRKYKRGGSLRVHTSHRGRRHYKAQLLVAGRLYNLGCYLSADEAARAYDEAVFLASHHHVMPWYLRFNSELDFLDPSGERLRPEHEVQILSEPVRNWWERTFADAAKRVVARTYYTALGISLDPARVKHAPRRCSRLALKGARRGLYGPKLHKKPASREWFIYAEKQSNLFADYSI